MRHHLPQVAFAAFFMLLGIAVAVIGMVMMDSKTSVQSAQTAPQGAVDCGKVAQTVAPTEAVSSSTSATLAANPVNASTNKRQAKHTTDAVIQLRKGAPLVVYDILDANRPPIEFVPFYNAQDEFDKVAVYRNQRGALSTSYDKQMDMMYPLPKASREFPPISLEVAQQKAAQYKPNAYPQYQGRLVTFASIDVPYYYFTMQNDSGALLVDALTGAAQVVSSRDLEDEKKFQAMQGEGMGDVMTVVNGKFHTSPEILKKLPKRERKIIQAEQQFFNDMIDKGLLKINEQGDFVEDRMTAEHREKFDNIMDKLLGTSSP